MEAQGRVSGAQKAAILLAVVGEEAATVILRNLPERDAQRIAEELIDLRNVAPEVANAVLAECHKAAIGDEFGLGGSEYAKQLLLRAYGEEAGRTLLRKVSRLREAPGNFDWLAEVGSRHAGAIHRSGTSADHRSGAGPSGAQARLRRC